MPAQQAVSIYDVFNRLKVVKEHLKGQKSYRVLSMFSYDGDGGRMQKIDFVQESGLVRKRKKKGRFITKRVMRIVKKRTHYVGGLFEKENGVQKSYIYAGSQRVAVVSQNKVEWFLTDHLGSVSRVVDGQGSVKQQVDLSPWGETESVSVLSSRTNEAVTFTGKKVDGLTGLYYFGARYYDPMIARFMTADTLVPYPSNPQAFNRYAYVHNNPIKLVDSNGQFAFLAAFAWAAIQGAFVGAAVGAGLAVVTGNDIAQGAMMGAIGGAAFGGLNNLFQGFTRFATVPGGMGPMTSGADFTANTLGNIFGGAVGGAASASYLGADPLTGAGYGALSGGVFGGISRMPATGWAGVRRAALSGIAGGGISEMSGGSFSRGAALAGGISFADTVYRSALTIEHRTLGVGSSMKTAKKKGLAKLGVNGEELTVVHKDPTVNHVGLGSKKSYEFGSLAWAGNETMGETGVFMNSLGRFVPGFQGLALAHDPFQHQMNGVRALTNFPSMSPLYGLNMLGASMNDNPSLIGIYEVNR